MSESRSVDELDEAMRTLQLTQFSVDVAAEAMFTVAPSGCILSGVDWVTSLASFPRLNKPRASRSP